MNIGIKVGPDDGISVLQKSGAKYVEVYYRLDLAEEYLPLFEFMNKQGIKFGLHFWATIFGKYFPCLIYYKKGIAEETERLITQTIKTAGEYGATYVNYHPEGYRLLTADLDKKTIELSPAEEINHQEGFASLVTRSKRLKEYAKNCKTEITIETVPKFAPGSFAEGAKEKPGYHTVPEEGLETEKMLELGKMGFSICFDLCHSAGQYPQADKETIYKNLLRDASNFVPYTKLIHINTLLPPFDGADSHNGILDSDFKQGVFPTKEQLISLINLFKDKQDLWLIPEPQKAKMIDNYFELLKLFS